MRMREGQVGRTGAFFLVFLCCDFRGNAGEKVTFPHLFVVIVVVDGRFRLMPD